MKPNVVGWVVVGVLAVAGPARAQFAVFDPAVTAQNRAAAIIKDALQRVQDAQHTQLRLMAQRLSAASLDRYRVAGQPPWRAHAADGGALAAAYLDALNAGDPTGAASLALRHPVVASSAILDRLTPAARRALAMQLARLDVADATLLASTHDTGRVRDQGRRREQPAVDALEAQILDPAPDRSTTGVVDTLSAAVLVGARQRQARLQVLTGLVEHLLVDTARARDTAAAALNAQLVTWRDGPAANAAFIAGSGDALRSWRQP